MSRQDDTRFHATPCPIPKSLRGKESKRPGHFQACSCNSAPDSSTRCIRHRPSRPPPPPLPLPPLRCPRPPSPPLHPPIPRRSRNCQNIQQLHLEEERDFPINAWQVYQAQNDKYQLVLRLIFISMEIKNTVLLHTGAALLLFSPICPSVCEGVKKTSQKRREGSLPNFYGGIILDQIPS